MKRAALPSIVLVATLFLAGAVKYPQILDSWSSGEIGTYRKLIVVAITQDDDVRKHFEDKFVSHLRVRNIEAVTSYSIVPNLDAPADREAILKEIREQGIDGAIAVRLIALKDRTEEAWAEEWRAALDESLSKVTLRQVIEETEPVNLKSAKLFGVEVGVWDADSLALVWVARTDAFKRKQLRDSGGAFAEVVLNVLEDEGVFRRTPRSGG
ncbi:MAG: hypothetical protein PVF68_06170 [Acidobacteriota bacterium]|jgi:hypothetical protein